jgi:hypothetical protein
VKALQAAADHLSPDIIRKRLDSWTLVLGPRFSKKDRAAIPLRREYSLNQVHRRIRGKLHSMLENLDHGHHGLRIYGKSLLAGI